MESVEKELQEEEKIDKNGLNIEIQL